MRDVLRRLEHLEQQNAELREEVRGLRNELSQQNATAVAPPTPPLEDRVAVVENRVEEQAQTKVEAFHRLPVRLTGMLLFNAFANSSGASSRSEGGAYSGLLSGPDRDGATVGQTLLGVRFDGPELPGGGRVHGSLDMDFLGGALTGSGSNAYGYSLRIRRGVVDFDWANRSFTVGEDKPLISQREPDSLSEVATPPLAAAGNPWYWQPQVRYDERIHFNDNTGLNAAVSVIQTIETAALSPAQNAYLSLDPARPGLEGRVAIWRRWGDNRRIELGPGFHLSTTHLNGYSIPSRFASLDWLVQPARWIEWTGLIFGGQNMANLGGFSTGFVLHPGYAPSAVRGIGGWSQLSFPITQRLTFHAFGGFQAPEASGLSNWDVSHASAIAANVMYRIGSNVLIGAEALQQRIGYSGEQYTIQNHYDLALGYLF